MEREREQAQRQRELANIKRAHEKELQRIKEKIDVAGSVSTPPPHVATCTRAAPGLWLDAD